MLRNIAYNLSLLTVAAPFAACSMMDEKLDDCPTGLYVRFVYDYNTLRADLFKDHVGHVQLYVFDENGNLAAQRTVSNTPADAPLADYGYTIHFTPAELPAGHSYRLQAVAMQRDWGDALATDGAKYRHASITHSESMAVSLDHDDAFIPGTEQYQVSDSAPLDTLWHTLKVITHLPTDGISVPRIDNTVKPYSIYPIEDQMVRVDNERATYATVSLIRDTNHLNITLREIDDPASVTADKYEIKIMDNNAHVAHDNNVMTHDSVRYTPYASWTSRFLSDGSMDIETVHKGDPGQFTKSATRVDDDGALTVTQRTAHYNMMFNRLMFNDEDNSDNAILQIMDKETGAVVVHINLPYILSQGRMAYEIYNYGSQEYLDREYDYHLNFFLKGDKWLAVEINVLSWSKRIQNVEL